MTFITFEGCEGSGKTTQAKLLENAYKKIGIDVISTREPGGTINAELIRNLIVDKDSPEWDPITELLLINAARYEHAKNLIIPSLKEGKTVLCDRFVDSTMAYQGFGRKIGKKLPALIHNFTMDGLSPDLTFILDIDPSEGRARVKDENKNRFENFSIDFHTRVRRGFQEIAALAVARCILIDASLPAKDIHKIVISAIKERQGVSLEVAAA